MNLSVHRPFMLIGARRPRPDRVDCQRRHPPPILPCHWRKTPETPETPKRPEEDGQPIPVAAHCGRRSAAAPEESRL